VSSTELPRLSPARLTEWLLDGEELALLDAREQGVYHRSHLFHASNVPLSQLELVLASLVPRRSTRVVWCDDGHSGLAERAANRATSLGWTACSVLDGGTAAWAASGGELYAGINVASKAFGEHVARSWRTPHISATELSRRLAPGSGHQVVVLDARPPGEFRRRSIPTGIDCPGAELVYRVRELAADPSTEVVVNCAGRTRSIIGAQSLIHAGLANPVMALENGTMGWHLAGLEVATGCEVAAPDPGGEAARWARVAADAVGRRFGVTTIDATTLRGWVADEMRTTYVLDVRTAAEFEAGHLPGSQHAPGGQLVQATDDYVATRNARLVLVDDDEVRATMTASWLRQMGWREAVVVAGGIDGGAGDRPLVKGQAARSDIARVAAPTIRPPDLAARLASEGGRVTVIDIGTSVKYRRRGHVPGAWWGVRSRLDQARAVIGPAEVIVLTSTDGTLAKLAVADASQHWPEATVLALAAGNKGWRHAGYEMEPGLTRPTTEPDDVWYGPYDHEADVARHMRDYLAWEVALVDQVDRDPLVSWELVATRPSL
jgi:rhodanese-related sulfurtransferase